MFRTALYGRTSKDDQRRVTIELQQKSLGQWVANDPEVDLVDGYWDADVSGKIPLWERPEGRRLIEDAEAGRVNCVAVLYCDRFGRTLKDAILAAEQLQDRGAHLVAVNDGLDSRRDSSPLYFQIRMVLAEEEHRRIAKRTQDGKIRAMERDNAPPGGPLVFGYRVDSRGRFIPDPEESAIVVMIFEKFLAGWRLAEIARWCEGLGIPAGLRYQKRSGAAPTIAERHAQAKWSRGRVSRILRSRVYIGERTWGDRTFPCVPLVDYETFDRVQAKLGGNRGRSPWSPVSGLLAGILTCGVCGPGHRFYKRDMVSRKSTGTNCRVYQCDSSRQGWSGSCKSKLLNIERLDAQVWELIESFLANPGDLIRKIMAQDSSLSEDVADLDRQEAACLNDLKSLDELVSGIWEEQQSQAWPLAWVTPRLNVLNERRKVTAARLAKVRERRSAVLLDQEQAASVTSALASIREKLREGLTPYEKREIVRLLIPGGVVRTFGEGKQKRAEVQIQLRWGEVATWPHDAQDSSCATMGYVDPSCLTVTLVCGKA